MVTRRLGTLNPKAAQAGAEGHVPKARANMEDASHHVAKAFEPLRKSAKRLKF